MTAYYNEPDPYAAQWLRNLIKAGHIAPGYVDERSIIDVKPEDLTEFTQCHFFAGIGVWSLALRNAGWPDEKPVWTGSCPCQPFSSAGNQRGQLDERHLAPVWLNLIRKRKPSVIFGEQVAGAISKHWLDDLFDELETEGYSCGAAVLPACSVGAPHKRDRLFFGAQQLADTCRQRIRVRSGKGAGSTGKIEGTEEKRQRIRFDSGAVRADLSCDMADGSAGHSKSSGRERTALCVCAGLPAGGDTQAGFTNEPANSINGFWRDADWLGCRDGKWRPVEPGTFPLAHGVTNRVGRLRAYGNAIVPQAATEFIIAFEGATS